MSNLYQWSVWLHMLAAFVFFFSHGAELATAFMLLKEKDANGMKALLNITQITLIPFGVSMLLLLVTSIHMGVVVGWWKRGWWGFSFLMMVGMLIWMIWYARKYYSPIRKALGSEYRPDLARTILPKPPKIWMLFMH